MGDSINTQQTSSDVIHELGFFHPFFTLPWFYCFGIDKAGIRVKLFLNFEKLKSVELSFYYRVRLLFQVE